jgi:hypothetical protein
MNAKILSIAAAAGLLIGSTAIGYAQSTTPDRTPGHQMQEQGSKTPDQPGASGYSPGHQMQEKGKGGDPGASGYAPGRQDTTGQSGGADNRNRGTTTSPAR